MIWQAFKAVSEKYGDILVVVFGSLVCIIVSFINWIIFIAQLIKSSNLDIDSLILAKDKE